MAILLCQLADVLDAKTIDVLFISDCRCNSVFGDVLRKRELDKNTMNIWVMVKASDILQQLGLCNVLRVVFVPREYVCLRASTQGSSKRKYGRTSSAAFNFMRMYVPAYG